MDRWEYQITTHPLEEVLKIREELGYPPEEESGTVVYCDTEGVCFFDDASNSYVEAMVHILNEQGERGWELVQIAFREADFISIWRREL
jgi:hypothetical protein